MKHLPQITASAPGENDTIQELSAVADNGVAVINIRGRIISIESELFEMDINTLIEQGIQDAVIRINSPGGNLFEANEIANMIKRFPGTIRTEIGALCASAATIPALEGQSVKMAKNGMMMIHRPMIGTEGNEDDLESTLQLLRTLQDEMARKYSEKTGMSVDEIKNKWQKDWWMSADEAKRNGFVDEVIGETDFEPEDFREVFSMGYSNIPDQIAAQAFKPKQHSS